MTFCFYIPFSHICESTSYIQRVIHIQNVIYALFVTSVMVTGQQSEKTVNIRLVGFIKEKKAFE